MKVILQQDVKGQGKKGQLVEVSDGYGRNFLLPRKLAVEATSDNLNTMKLQEKARRAEEARQRAAAEEIAGRLKGLTVKIYAKTGKDGRLFGAISAAAIADAVKEQLGQTIDRRRVIIASPIKAAGDYTVTVGLHSEVSANLRVRVIATK